MRQGILGLFASSALYGLIAVIVIFGLIPNGRPTPGYRLHSILIAPEASVLKMLLLERPRVQPPPDEEKKEPAVSESLPVMSERRILPPEPVEKASEAVVSRSTAMPAPESRPESLNFFSQYTDLTLIGQKLLWDVPNLKLAILDDGTGAWWKAVQKLQRDAAFFCGKTASSGKVLILSSTTHSFALSELDTTRFYVMRVNHAGGDVGIGEFVR